MLEYLGYPGKKNNVSAKLAVIDFGTNTARLLIADRCGNGDFRRVFLRREIVRMGGGFTRTEGLSYAAMQRALECLDSFAEIIRNHDVSNVLAVATSAVRDAVNGAEFVDQALCKTGIELKVIDGITEGKLTLAGVMAGLDCPCDEALVFDIGGGSTEYTLAKCGRAEYVNSLPLGVVRLIEGKDSLAAMEHKIFTELELLVEDMRRTGLIPGNDASLIGTSGTSTTLAAILLNMNGHDHRSVNNMIVSKGDVKLVFDLLEPMTPEERLGVAGLEKGKEDLIVAGLLIILQTMDLFKMDKIQVSDYGLLEGLVVRGAELVH